MVTIKAPSLEPNPLTLYEGADISALARWFPFVVLKGGPCAGKTFLESILLASGKFRTIVKGSTRDPRLCERNGEVPFCHLTWREWFSLQATPRLEGFFIGEVDRSWDDCERILMIKPPSLEEIYAQSQQFVIIYRLADIENACRLAAARNQGIVISLFEHDAHAWRKVFPETRFVTVETDLETRLRRFEQREGGLSSVANRARLYTAVSTETRLRDPDLHIANNTDILQITNALWGYLNTVGYKAPQGSRV